MSAPAFTVKNNFLEDYPSFRAHCDSVDYNGCINEADKVFYPGVSLDIPNNVRHEVQEKIENIEGHKINVNALFLRMSVEGVKAPHQAHTDTIMGDKSFMLYLNKEEDCQGGTSLVQHESGLYREPCCESSVQVWKSDHSNKDKWSVTDICEMKENKACIFDAQLMHRAEPVNGFGSTPEDGRLVLTVFFSEAA